MKKDFGEQELNKEQYIIFLEKIFKILKKGYKTRIEDFLKNNSNLVNEELPFYLEFDYFLDAGWSKKHLLLVSVNLGKYIKNYYSDIRHTEITIQIYQRIVKFFKRDSYSEHWARTQMLLGGCYFERTIGDKKYNIEQAIKAYQMALEILTYDFHSKYWAEIQVNLGNAYSERISGQKHENNELAINAYHAAIEVYTLEERPYRWAKIKESIGHAFFERTRGDRSNNIEQAIESYEQSGKVYLQTIKAYQAALSNSTQSRLCYDCAINQYNLGVAYRNRIVGDKKENIELSIKAYRTALSVLSYRTFPDEWAKIQNNLGNAYSQRIAGDKKENIELAIGAYQAALIVKTYEDSPSEWALTKMNLGNAYSQRIARDKKENIELAIEAYKASLEVYTPDDYSYEWARSKMNLGNAYQDRIVGDRTNNTKLAIEAYQVASTVWTRENYPDKWAKIQINLGNAYSNGFTEEKRENFNRAIDAYQVALEIITFETHHYEWANVYINIGYAYWLYVSTGDRCENIEKAIKAYRTALKVFTREAYPHEYAGINNNIGNAYLERIKGDASDSIEEAVKAYKAALEIYTCKATPREHIRTAKNLGKFFLIANRWQESIEIYQTAAEAIELTRSWGTSDTRRQEIQIDALEIYDNLIRACIKTSQTDLAIKYSEHFRSRMLVDLVAGRELDAKDLKPEKQKLIEKYAEFQTLIDLERQYLSNKSNPQSLLSDNDTPESNRASFQASSEKIIELEREKQIIFEEIRKTDPVLAGEIQVDALEFEQIRQLISDSQTAIVSFYSIGEETHVFIVYQNRESQHYVCQQQKTDLKTWTYEHWLQPYQVAFDTRKLKSKAEKRQREKQRQRWIGLVSVVMRELSQRLNLDRLIEEYLQGIEELIIIPHGYLHNIPFAALPISDTEYLNDRFRIRHAPSCQILKFCQDRQPVANVIYGTVEDADGSLPGARLEGQKVAQLFNIPETNRLIGKEQSTVTEYRQLARRIQALHSSHHALSRLDNPLESALQLANGSITLGELLLWRLDDLEEVFLSCCETNLGVAELTDDFLTLASGFLCAGARGVISSLWVADDLSAILLSMFYYQLRKEGKSRSAALQQAQQQLRKLTGGELAQLLRCDLKPYKDYLEERFKKANTKWRNASRQLKKLEAMDCENKDKQDWEKEKATWGKKAKKHRQVVKNLEEVRCKEEFPFANPYYWGVFICSGLA